jgi:dTDP-4-amino-4,6-dideoxygalactose transaminase
MLDVMTTGAFVGGPYVDAFEAEFALFSGVSHCVTAASGTDALELALRGCDLRPGARVVVPANSFVGKLESTIRAGGAPVLVDCDEHGLMDPSHLADRIDGQTGAVVPVHSSGQMCRMEEIADVIVRSGHDIAVIENSSQGHGATRNGLPAGAWSRASATCFYHDRILTAYGDGGAVLTSEPAVAARVRQLANHGLNERFEPEIVGFASQLHAIHAVILRAKLARLGCWIDSRRKVALDYLDRLAGLAADGLVVTPSVLEGNESVWSRFVIRVPNRDRLFEALRSAGIEAAVHHRTPLHLAPAYRDLGYGPGDFPMAEQLASEVLSLPIYPSLTESAVDEVVTVLDGALRGRR